jgi:hypothetical protein
MDDAAPHQAAELGIHHMECGLCRVRELRNGENHLPVQGPLFSEEVLPFQSFHG